MKLWQLLTRYKQQLTEVGLLIVVSCTPLLWIGNQWVILGHDSGFRFNIADHFQGLWHGWYQGVNFGIDRSLYKGFLLIQFPELLFQWLLESLASAQSVVFPFWFLVMGLGMYVGVRGFFPHRNQWFIRVYTSFFWVFNFYILQGWGIVERAKFSLYAALPISLLLISRTVGQKMPISVGAALFGLLYFFCNGGGSPPLFGASIIVWGITWSVSTIWLIRERGIKGISHAFLVAVAFACLFVLCNAYWIVVNIELFRGVYSQAVGDNGGIEGLLAWEEMVSKYASIQNLVRLQGIPDWYDNTVHSFSRVFSSNPLLILLSYLPISSICVGLLLIRKKSISLNRYFITLCVFFGIAGLFFAAGSHPPSGHIYVLMMKYIPGFAIFRSSFYKFAPVVWLSIIMLSGYFLQQYISLLKRPYRWLLGIGIVLSVLLYHYPFFTTSIFQFAPAFSTRLSVPSYVGKTQHFLSTFDAAKARILLLPELDRGFINQPIDTYSWGFYSLDVLPRLLTNIPIIANDASAEPVSAIYDAIYSQNWQTFEALATQMGITHILYRSDIQRAPSSRSRIMAEQILGEQFYEPIFTEGEWSIYDLQTKPVTMRVTTNFLPLLGGIEHDSEFMRIASQSVSIRISENAKGSQLGTYGIEARCQFCIDKEYQHYQSGIFLPAERFTPGTLLFRIFRESRLPMVVSGMSPSAIIDTNLSRSLFRLRHLQQVGSKSILFGEYFADYRYTILSIISSYQDLSAIDKVSYAARLSAYLGKERAWLIEYGIPTPKEIEVLEQQLGPYLWISNDDWFRYVVNVPTSGIFKWYSSEFIPSIQIDNDFVSDGNLITLEAGVHLLAVNRTELNTSNIPRISLLSQTQPILDDRIDYEIILDKPLHKIVRIPASDIPFVLEHPVTHDPRWQLNIIEGNAVWQEKGITNGYANGWLIQSDGPILVEITYAMQRTFLYSMLLTACGLLVSVWSIVRWIYYKTQ